MPFRYYQYQQRPQQQPRRPRQNQNRQNQQRTKFCKFCNFSGHWGTQCRKRKRYLHGNMQDVLCRKCIQYGHFLCQCHLPNPTRVPHPMLDISNCPPPPQSQPQYTIPVPKQGTQHTPPPPSPPNNTDAIRALTDKVNLLVNKHEEQSRFLKQVQFERTKLNAQTTRHNEPSIFAQSANENPM